MFKENILKRIRTERRSWLSSLLSRNKYISIEFGGKDGRFGKGK